jgi:hypothetical protein
MANTPILSHLTTFVAALLTRYIPMKYVITILNEAANKTVLLANQPSVSSFINHPLIYLILLMVTANLHPPVIQHRYGQLPI